MTYRDSVCRGRVKNMAGGFPFLRISLLVIVVSFLGGCETLSRWFEEYGRDVDRRRATPPATIGDRDLSPRGLLVYLNAFPNIDTGAEFVEVLPDAFKRNWIMMTRSESLQTGTARSPRIILRNDNSSNVFSLALTQHPSFPLAHPDKIEYMQWDDSLKTFRFHEIDLTRPPISRVRADDPRCSNCHFTTAMGRNKPNWDAYDSWGGMLPFNRDAVYQGSVEAVAMRDLFRLGTGTPVGSVLRHLTLPVNPAAPELGLTTLGIPESLSGADVTYNFGSLPAAPVSPGNFTNVQQGGSFFSIVGAPPPPSSIETRSIEPRQGVGVSLFDNLTAFNTRRIAQELIDHPFSSTAPDVLPITLAITNGCNVREELASFDPFFTSRNNGMNFDAILTDTISRRHSLPRRKADIQRLNLTRQTSDGRDPYLFANEDGLIQAYGSSPLDISIPRIRREVFRRHPRIRARDAVASQGITEHMIDRETYGDSDRKIALFRYYLEPLGVPVDKWSMGVRGRSRTYTFADLFNTYETEFNSTLGMHHLRDTATTDDCARLIMESRTELGRLRLPPAPTPPPYSDVQRIFNKSCIECHGGQGYPPAYPSPGNRLNLSEGVSYSSIQNLRPGGADIIIGRITMTGEDCPGGMMPCGGPALSAADINTIQRWIAGGALGP